eukprot:TRINITY_DN67920_c5_g1_i1.p1 TRINITY_DN67920_c5_g1~~TRINITY_DN67920_c5_g1_i1.p1  ORF type:complete len:146 (-),score=0.17 TRINITY_DN67920_c5_g1_i1:332-769(-)
MLSFFVKTFRQAQAARDRAKIEKLAALPWKQRYTQLERRNHWFELKKDHPFAIPVILEPSPGFCQRYEKFLVPDNGEMSVAAFRELLIQKLTLSDPSRNPETIVLYTEDGEPSSLDSSIATLVEENQNEDGFLYLRAAYDDGLPH